MPTRAWATIVSPSTWLKSRLTGTVSTGTRALPENGNYSDFMNVAILRYDGAADEDPTADPSTDVPTSSAPLVETDLHVRPHVLHHILLY